MEFNKHFGRSIKHEHAEFGEVESLVIDGVHYFPATQCARILGFKAPESAVRTHCKGETINYKAITQGAQTTKYIQGGDLYRLSTASKSPKARDFERWIFGGGNLTFSASNNEADIQKLIKEAAMKAADDVVKQLTPIINEATERAEELQNRVNQLEENRIIKLVNKLTMRKKIKEVQA